MSAVDVVADEAVEKRAEQPQRKRMSIFRLKSSQAKAQQLEINNAVDDEYLEPVDRWAESGYVVDEDQREQRHYNAPLHPVLPQQR